MKSLNTQPLSIFTQSLSILQASFSVYLRFVQAPEQIVKAGEMGVPRIIKDSRGWGEGFPQKIEFFSGWKWKQFLNGRYKVR
jgi:hypothetical protein